MQALKPSLLVIDQKYSNNDPALTVRLLELGHLKEDYPTIRFFFAKRISKIEASAMQPLKTLKPFEITWRLRKQPSNLRMLLVARKKNLRICCFQKTLWLDDLLPSAPVAVNPPWCSNTEFNGLDNLVPRSPTAKGKQSEIWVRD